MEPFSGLRRPAVEEKSPPQTTLIAGAHEGVVPETQSETTPKLGALVVALAPFGIAAWVAIGFYMYRLIT
jgi:hypothetical protein